LGYVNSTKVILGLPKTAGVHFLLRPYDTIISLGDQAIKKRRSTGKYALSIEAPFTGTLETVGISGGINQSGRYIFTSPWE